jgi:hypothetical protein
MPEATDEELGLDPQQMEGLDPNIRAELRKSRQLAKDLHAAEVAKGIAERDATFVRAGIPDSPLGQMFAKGYDGDPTDVAAVKAAFDALGVAGGQTPPASEDPGQNDAGPTDAELESQRRIATAGAAGDNDGSIRYEDAIHAAKSEDDVMALLAAAPSSAVDFNGRRVIAPQID